MSKESVREEVVGFGLVLTLVLVILLLAGFLQILSSAPPPSPPERDHCIVEHHITEAFATPEMHKLWQHWTVHQRHEVLTRVRLDIFTDPARLNALRSNYTMRVQGGMRDECAKDEG